MAKKTRKAELTETKPVGVTLAAATEDKLEDFAQDLGRLLGQAQNKAESWLDQRKAIAAHLTGLRDTATRLLGQLGIADTAQPARRGRKPGSATSGQSGAEAGTAKRGRPVKKKRVMSAEAREKIAAAQRARWAKQREMTKGRR